MRKLLLLPFLLFALFACAEPNITGTWKLDRDASTGSPSVQGASLLVITQSGDALTFDYYPLKNGQRGDLLQSDGYTTDGLEHPGYKTRTYVTYLQAYWRKKQLVTRTRAIMDPEGYQTFTNENHWSLSEDGKTLTDKSSDGKKVVYSREPAAQ